MARRALLILTAFSSAVFAQDAANRSHFEVASMKVSKAPPGQPPSIQKDPGRVSYGNVNLLSLICEAYGVRPFQVASLGSAGDARFDIEAAFGDGGPAQYGPMLQVLLEERLKLKTRREMRDTPVYAVTVAEGGLKMRPVSDAPPDVAAAPAPPPKLHGVFGRGQADSHVWRGVAPISGLVANLSYFVDRPMVDLTGLKGSYDCDLHWQDGSTAPGNGGALVSAMRKQLGLNVAPGKLPVEYIVVERVETAPTAN